MSPSSFQTRSLHNGNERLQHRRARRGRSLQDRLQTIRSSRFTNSKPPRNKRSLTWFGWAKRIAMVGAACLVLYFGYLWFTLPDISEPTSFLASQSTVITDRNEVELYRVFQEENRTYINDSLIPTSMKQAIVAIEDERYYDRGCLDVIALARAVFYMGKAGGASTLTRQLARNALDLHGENVINRKLKELALGCQMEHRYTKDELLGLYLNWIPFGQNAYGIEQASKTYFGISAQELTIAQSAILASLPQRPTYFSPYGSHVHTEVSESITERIDQGLITDASEIPEESITIGLLGAMIGSGSNVVYIGGRTDQVLKNMLDQGYITESERQSALDELRVMEFSELRESIRAAHFVLWVREQVEALLGEQYEEGLLERGGLQVKTTLDWNLQETAERIVTEEKENIVTQFGAHNISLLSVDAQTNEILAYVGNMDFNDTEFGGKIDMIQVPRQPGSSFKPFVYLSAFAKGYSPATVLYDVPTKIGDDQPQNFDAGFNGPMTIRSALGSSRNIPAAKAFFLGGGEDEILDLVESLGAGTPKTRRDELLQSRSDFKYGWPLALGAAETPMSEMVNAYSTLARQGKKQSLISILSIVDKDGNILYEDDTPEPVEVIDPRLAYEVTSILSDVNARPEGFWRNQLSVPGFQVAAKTGTSNKCLETNSNGSCRLRKPDNAWLMGYSPELVTGVWVGNADNSAMFDKGGGLNSASPIWKEFMVEAHKTIESPVTSFVQPSGMVSPQISNLSGQLPAPCTPIDRRVSDIFLEENTPSELDYACTTVLVDKVTGLLASDACPVEAQEERSFFVARSILPERWPLWEQGVQEWANEQQERYLADQEAGGSGSSVLPLPLIPTEKCDPALTPGRLQKPVVEILSPTSMASTPAFVVRLDILSASEIKEVRYEIDGKLAATETRPPFRGMVSVPRSIATTGQHTLTVTVIDEYFNQATDTQTITFGKDTSEPEVTITSPDSSTPLFVGDTVNLEADASDPDGGIRYVQWYLDDVLLSTRPQPPYNLEYTLDVEAGTHTIEAVAYDFADNTYRDSMTISVLSAADKDKISQGGTTTEPVIFSPSEDTVRLTTRETLPIVIGLPRFTSAQYDDLELSITNQSSGAKEVIFSLSQSNGGTSNREWNPGSGGTYALELFTTKDGVKTVWEELTVIVR